MTGILTTGRLRLRLVTEDDAPFYLALVNDPAFIAQIGERKLRTLGAALRGLREGPIAMQAARGHSLYLVERLADGAPLGLSGLVKRDTLGHLEKPAVRCIFGLRCSPYARTTALLSRNCRRSRRFFEVPPGPRGYRLCLLPEHRGHGYAFEAGQAVVRHAAALGIRRLAAIVSPGNTASIALLERLGLRFDRCASLAPGQPPLNVYLADLDG